MVDPEIVAYYERGLERDRIASGAQRIEFLRVWELLERHLPPAPAVVLDVGGAAGVYAFPLAAAGYQVHLVDPVPLHVEQATAAARNAAAPLAGATVGDARALEAADASVDAVLLLGPLYHLTARADRIKALQEAARVLRPGGLVVAAGLSRFYPVFEGLVDDGLARTPEQIERYVADGRHANPAGDPAHFTTSYFHRPAELAAEVREAGLDLYGPLIGASGILKLLLPDLAARLEDPVRREQVLTALRLLETEPSIIGMSQKIIALARAPEPRDQLAGTA